MHLESTNWPKFLFVCVIFVLEIINKKFDTTVYQTASELDTPVAENLPEVRNLIPQGEESYIYFSSRIFYKLIL